MFIDGFGLAGYRSFGEEIQRIGLCDKINIIVGQNNSGKSNILAFIVNHLTALHKSNTIKLEQLDEHISVEKKLEPRADVAVKIFGDRYTKLFDSIDKHQYLAKEILESNALTSGGDVAWFSLTGLLGNILVNEDQVNAVINEVSLDERLWSTLYRTLARFSSGSYDIDWVRKSLFMLSTLGLGIPPCSIVPAIRKIGDFSSTSDGFDGKGIIQRLALLQNPLLDRYDHNIAQFDKINYFLQNVTENETAKIEIPNDRKMIIVHMDGKRLPIERLGTGIHEVVILAIAATVLENQIVCMEEPELHLHPLLQKKLLRYLDQETSNQYFITTHSAHLMDMPGASVFHVRLEDGCSKIEPVFCDGHKSRICDDLGYKASDIMQSNSIIWVEGPSDRIYINHWIKAIDSELVEGLHYSIMFYGGRLLSHLTAEDEEVKEFISLSRLNRHMAIVIDSDRDAAGKHVNQTKKRIEKEFEANSGFVWVTKGREIENYIEIEMLKDSVVEVCPKAVKFLSTGDYDNRMKYFPEGPEKSKVIDKIKMAKKVASCPANLNVLDLGECMGELVRFINMTALFLLKNFV